MDRKGKLWTAGLVLIAGGVILVRVVSPRLSAPFPVLAAYFGGLVIATVGLFIVTLAIRSGPKS
ncbi:MAG: hypothetical protein ACUVSK_12335 [Desulfotomaculales bacterium]